MKDKDGASPIAAEFIFEFIRLFGPENLIVTNTRITDHFPRRWGIGKNISRITTREKKDGSQLERKDKVERVTTTVRKD